MGPMVLGLAVTQLNTLLDSFIAWGLAATTGEPLAIAWLGGTVELPNAQRSGRRDLYRRAVLSVSGRHLGYGAGHCDLSTFKPARRPRAKRVRCRRFAARLRLIWLLTIPASVGLILLAEPLAKVLFERGQFTAADTARAARVIACYASGVWAYCAIPVLVRGYYALADRATPVRLGMATVALNLLLNLTLVWPLAEAGLAVSTSVAAAAQVLGLVALFSRRHARLDWSDLWGGVWRSGLLTLVMAAAVMAASPGCRPARPGWAKRYGSPPRWASGRACFWPWPGSCDSRVGAAVLGVVKAAAVHNCRTSLPPCAKLSGGGYTIWQRRNCRRRESVASASRMSGTDRPSQSVF